MRTAGCKWRDEHYPDDVYPPYAGGMFYILSQRAMEGALAGIRAAKQAGRRTYWANEDATMGTWVQRAGFESTHMASVWPARVTALASPAVPPIALHLDWTTGQHVHFAQGYDRAKLTERLLLASHANLLSHGLSMGLCSSGAGSLIHKREVLSTQKER